MFKMNRAVRGSISIFLVLILLPMMTYSTMIIDATRLQSVRSNIQGAGDLALNAALSEYDVMLEQMYGLFGNIDYVYDNAAKQYKPADGKSINDALEAYFQQTLESELIQAGITDVTKDQTKNAVKNITNLVLKDDTITEDDISDFINAQVENFTCEPVYGGALANPNVMKQQVVEYMKYKAPISLTSGLYSKLKSMNNASKQTEAINNKVKYEELLSELQNPAIEAYKALVDYNECALSINPLCEDGNQKKEGLYNLFESADKNNPGAKKFYEYATTFYLMSSSENVRKYKEHKVNYNDIENSVSKDTSYYDNELNQIGSGSGSLDDQIKQCEDKLNKLEGFVNNYFKLDGSDGGKVQNNICRLTFNSVLSSKPESNVNIIGSDTVEYVYGKIPSSPAGISNESGRENNDFPCYSFIGSGKGKWYEELDDKGEKDYDKRKEFCEKYLKVLENFDKRINGIKQFVEYTVNIDALYSLYNTQCDIYNELLTEKFKSEYQAPDDIKNNYAKIKEAWKEYADDTDRGGKYYTRLSNLKKIEAAKNGLKNHKRNIENYINRFNDINYFDAYAYEYAMNGSSIAFFVYGTLDHMEWCLKTASTSLESLISKIKEMDEQKEKLRKSIEKIDSESTKASMKSEYDMLVKQFDVKEAEDLKKVVDELIPVVGRYKGNAKEVSYLDLSLVKTTTMNKELNKGMNELVNENVKNKFFNWVAKKVVNSDVVNKKLDEVVKDSGWEGEIPVPPDIQNKDEIKNAQNINSFNDAENQSKNLISTKFKYAEPEGKLYPNGIEKVRVVDGIIDSVAEPIYTQARKDGMDHNTMEELSPDSDDYTRIIDKEEDFFWILRSIADSAAMAEKDSSTDDSTGGKGDLKKAEKASSDAKDSNGRNGESETVDEDDPKYDGLNDKEKKEKIKEDKAAIKEKVENGGKKIDEAYKQVTEYITLGSADGDFGNYSVDTPTVERGKNAAKSKSNDSVSKSSSVLSMIQNALNAMAQGACSEEYFTEMFTCRTDTLPNKEVTLLNGYSNTGTKMIPYKDEGWYGYEIEYILWGQSDLNQNYVYTDALIFVIRFGLNLIYTFTSADINAFSFSIASAVCIGPAAVAIPIVQSCVKILLAMAESGIDVIRLHQGMDIPIYKDINSFVCSPRGIKSLSDDAKKWAKEKAKDTVDKGAAYVEKSINKQIEKINNEVKKGASNLISDNLDKLEKCTSDFIDNQTESVKKAVVDAIVNPIVSKMSTMGGDIMAIREYQSEAMVGKFIEGAVDDAFESIRANAVGDGIAAKALRELLNKKREDGTKYEDVIKNLITGKLKDIYKDNKKYIIDQNTIEKSINEIIDKQVGDNVEAFISSELNKVGESINKEIAGATDTKVEEAKNYMHEKFAEASEKISGKAGEMIDKIPSGNSSGFDTKAASSGLTLNYKEYCKIFILMNLAMNQDSMYQRAAALIQVNVQCKESDFKMINANTLFNVRADVKMKTLFPWGVESKADDATGDSSLAFDFSSLGKSEVKIGYCGVNGY